MIDEMENKNNSFKEIWDKLKSCKKIAMTLHYAPDGDSLGGCSAMKYVLEKNLGCEVTLVSYDSVSSSLNNLSCSKEIEFGKDISDLNGEDFDVFLFMDSGSPSAFSGKLMKDYSLPKNSFIINMDHHNVNAYFGDMNYVDSSKPSICALLTDFFIENEVRLDKELSTRLLIGVSTDSGFFQYSNANSSLKYASLLIANGVDYYGEIASVILLTSLRLRKYFSLLFTNIKIDETRRVGYSSVSYEKVKEFGLSKSEVRLGINEMQTLSEVDFVFNLIELEDHIKGSFRSTAGRNVDVSLFAQKLGGGGHKVAAAFILPKIFLEEAEKRVLKTIDEVGIHTFKE